MTRHYQERACDCLSSWLRGSPRSPVPGSHQEHFCQADPHATAPLLVSARRRQKKSQVGTSEFEGTAPHVLNPNCCELTKTGGHVTNTSQMNLTKHVLLNTVCSEGATAIGWPPGDIKSEAWPPHHRFLLLCTQCRRRIHSGELGGVTREGWTRSRKILRHP